MTTAAKQAYPDLNALLAAAATKRFTNARMARAIWYGICDVQNEDLHTPPAYTRLLGCNKKGRTYLSAIRRSATIPVLTKPADIPPTPAARRQASLEQAFADLYTLALPHSRPAGFFLRAMPYLGES